MFFIGQLTTTPTVANSQADVIGLLTGSITNINQLSSNFIQASCKMVSTTAPGWNVLDAAAGPVVNTVTPKVISSPWSDDATKNKPIKIGSASANNLTFDGYESWNATTHIGINKHVTTTAGWQTRPFTASNWIMITASANHIGVFIWPAAISTTSFINYFFASEYSRDDYWNTVANGYPAWFTSGHSGNYYCNTTDATGLALARLPTVNTGAIVDQISIISSSGGNPFCRITSNPILPTALPTVGTGLETLSTQYHSLYAMDVNKNIAPMMAALKLTQFNTPNSPCTFGSIDAKSPFIYGIASLGFQTGDEVIINGDTYFYMISAMVNPTASTYLLVKES